MTIDSKPQLAPRGRSKFTRVVVGVLIVLVGVIALLVVIGRDSKLQESAETYQGVSSVVLDLDNSPVELVVGGDEVEVSKSATVGFLGGSTREEQAGATLRLIHDCPAFGGFGCRASYSITVPRGTSVSGGTSNGGIIIEDVEGTIDVSTSNGSITLDGVSALEVRARTSNGRITGTGLLSPDMDVRTSNGRVSLTFVEAPTTVAIRSSNGEIEVVVPSDSPAYAVDSSTSNGQTRADIRTDPSSGNRIQASTSNGDITVRYAE